ncbi:hypothetical protein DMENIID0001_059610 [Sergentomyia squamirostris]
MSEYSRNQKEKLLGKIDVQARCNQLRTAVEVQEREAKIIRRYIADLEERMGSVENWISLQNKELEEYRRKDKQEPKCTKIHYPFNIRNEWTDTEEESDPEENLVWYYDYEDNKGERHTAPASADPLSEAEAGQSGDCYTLRNVFPEWETGTRLPRKRRVP